MKKILLGALLLLNGYLQAQNGLECIVVEKYYVSNANDTAVNSTGGVLPVGSVTYRIYADMLQGYTFQAAYGVDAAPTGAPGTISSGDHELRLQTSTLFFNNQDRGATSPTFAKSRCADNTVMLDSWLSVGAACSGNYGILKSADNGVANVVNGDGVLQNNDALAGIPLTTQDGLIAGTPGTVTEVGITNDILVFDNQNDGTNGPLFSTYNGSWACLGGCSGPDTIDNKVLIAQITTDGIFTYELNIQIGTPGGGIERYVARNPVGAEISLPCLIDTFGIPSTVIPTVSITSPASGSTYTVGNTVNIAATAATSAGTISQVEFFIDGSSIGIDNNAPYTATWTGTFGAHDLTAKATNSQGGQATSSIITINGLVSGINDLDATSLFSVYPVPAKNQLHVQLVNANGNSATTTYAIYDVVGTLLLHNAITKQNEMIDISSIAAGEYFIKVSADGFTSTKKISKF